MTAYPNWTAGEVVTEAKLDLYTTNLNAVCILDDASHALTDATASSVTWDTDTYDPRGWHGASAQNTQPDIAGYYQVTAAAGLITPTNLCARFIGRVIKNGGILEPFLWDVSPVTGGVSTQPAGSGCLTVVMNGTTDTLALQLYQDSDTTRSAISNMMIRLIVPT